MDFFYYFIRYTICRNLNRLFKPKNMLIIVIVLLVVFLLLKNESQAIYMGNDTYTDPNNTAILAYNSVLNDFLVRLDNNKESSYYQDIIDKIKDSGLGYYVYYGNADGSSVINSTIYSQDTMYIVFYDLTNPQTTTSQYDNYMGLDNIEVRRVECSMQYEFNNNGIYTDINISVLIPVPFYNYSADLITTYILSSSQEQTNSIVSAIENQTNAINEQTNTINEQNEYLQANPNSQDFSNSDLPNDSGVTDITTDGLNSIFTLFYNNMTREPNGSDIVEVNVPFTNKTFYIPYNYTATYVPTTIKSIISMFWYYVGGVFIIKDVFRKIEKLKSGEIENVENDNIKGDLL